MLHRAARAYARSLLQRPVLTNAVSAAVVLGAGDVCAQTLVERRARFDAVRTCTLASWGAFGHAPVFYAWFRFVDVRFGHVPNTWAACFAKACATAVVTSPSMNSAFFTWATAFEHFFAKTELTSGETSLYGKLRAKLRNDLVPVLKTSVCVWVPVNTISWRMLQPQWRVLATVVVGTAWSAFLSHAQHHDVR